MDKRKKDKVVEDKDKSLADKEGKLADLEKELSDLNSLEEKKKQLDREISSKEKELKKINNSVDSLNDNLQLTRELLEREKSSFKTQEKLLQESLKGDVNASLQMAYINEKEKRKEFQATLSIVIDKKNEIEKELFDLKANRDDKCNEINSERDYLEVSNERAVASLEKAKREKIILTEKLQKLEKIFQSTVDEKDKLLIGEKFLKDSYEKAKLSVLDEIKKCENYRVRIEGLELNLLSTREIELNHTNLQTKYETLQKSLNRANFKLNDRNKEINRLELSVKKKDLENRELKAKVWDAQIGNMTRGITGLVVSTTEHLPLPYGWHSKIKIISRHKTGWRTFLSTGLSILLPIWIFCYEVSRYLIRKIIKKISGKNEKE